MWDAFDEEFSIYNKYVFDQEDKPLSTKTGRRLSNLGIVTDTLYLFGIVTNPKFNEQVEKVITFKYSACPNLRIQRLI